MTLGTLYIIAAPSGGGKTSLVNHLLKQMENIKISTSFTTRPQRVGEQDGENYFFVSEKEFFDMVDNQALLEYAQVFGHYYGTSKDWVLKTLDAGIDVILEIDWQGARQICAQFNASVSIFILPPSLISLEQRLHSRGQDKPEVISHRMSQARDEISHCHEFDYWVINENFEDAVRDIETIINAQRLRSQYQRERFQDLTKELLETESIT